MQWDIFWGIHPATNLPPKNNFRCSHPARFEKCRRFSETLPSILKSSPHTVIPPHSRRRFQFPSPQFLRKAKAPMQIASFLRCSPCTNAGFLSPSPPPKEERAGVRRPFLSIAPLPDPRPVRSSRGEGYQRRESPPAICHSVTPPDNQVRAKPKTTPLAAARASVPRHSTDKCH